MSTTAVIALLVAIPASCTLGVFVGVWLSWCSYTEGWRDCERWHHREARKAR